MVLSHLGKDGHYDVIVSCMKVLASMVLWIVTMPILLLICFFRALSWFYVSISKGWTLLDHSQSCLFSDSPVSRHYMIAYFILSGVYTSEHLEGLRKRFHKYLRESESLPLRALATKVLGYLYWKPVLVDLMRHIRLADEIDPEVTYSQTQVEDMLCRLMETPTAPDMPQWEILVLPKVKFQTGEQNAKPQFCGIFRMHHGMGDGLSIMHIFLKYMLDDGFEFYPIPAPPVLPWWKMAAINMATIFNLQAYMWSSLFSFASVRHNLRPLVGKKFYRLSRPVSVDLIRFIKRKVQTRFSDVILSSGSSALQHHFQKINFRAETIKMATAAALHTSKKGKVTNSVVFVYLPVANRTMNPLRRLETTSEIISRISRSTEILKFYWRLYIMGIFFPTGVTEKALSHHNADSLMTYIPGPRNVCCYYGSPMVILGSVMPHIGRSGIGMSMITYVDQIRVGVIADGALVSGPSEVEDIAEDFVRNTLELGRMLGYKDETF